MSKATDFAALDRKTITRKQARKVLRKRSRIQEIARAFCKNKLAVIGFVILLFLIVSAVAAPLYIDYQEKCIDIDPVNRLLRVGSKGHFLGTDEMGRDIMSRCIYGTRVSLRIGCVAIAFSITAGIIIGALAGYFGGVIDTILMRFIDVVACLPATLLAMAIVAVFGTSERNLILAIAIATTSDFARIVRSSVLTTASMDYVEAARVLGEKDGGIIFKHVLINSMAPIIVAVSTSLAWSIGCISGLSYIGLGIPAPTPEWGNMLSQGRAYMRDCPYLVWVPGLFIFLSVLSLNLIGDGLRDALDPRLKQ